MTSNILGSRAVLVGGLLLALVFAASFGGLVGKAAVTLLALLFFDVLYEYGQQAGWWA